MKAVAKEVAFRPVTIEITLESSEEVAQFYAVFNHTKTLRAIRHENDGFGKTIRSAICQSVGVDDDSGSWHDARY